ncbi:AT-rich interactive domain-containing protein 6-like [Gastrolobium bilobum]|uniref:AT-rich interactive domain-containing protein 6-like n=1 Tax=Gastrolobium bilobum TaxID=150636 RepID=UPI002AB1DAAB|nr:AT-rich interactive domain-containing protein 6-like [Gastrolobium bilobum]
MNDAKENQEVGQGVPLAVEENQQVVDAQVQMKPEAASAPVSVEETSNHGENGKAEQPAEDKNVKFEAASEGIPQQDVENGKEEQPAEDKNVKLEVASEGIPQQDAQSILHSVPVEADAGILNRMECGEASDGKTEVEEFPESNKGVENDDNVRQDSVNDAETAVEEKPEACGVADSKTCDNGDHIPSSHNGPAENKNCNNGDLIPSSHNEPTTPQPAPADTKTEIKNVLEVESKADEKQAAEHVDNGNSNSKHMFFLDPDHCYDGNESGTDEEQSAFMKELENFFRERSMEFKPPKFYGEGLNCLKLWRAVTRLGGYDKVTSCKLWRQVGESFKPPKTCTTVSWTFRGFYEKALLDYERHKIKGGELNVPIAPQPEPVNVENQASASGRARRDAAARAMQGWHSQRLLGNGEVSDPIIKDRNSVSVQKREKQLKNINLLKRKKPSYMDNAVKAARSKPSKPQLDTAVVDIGPPADWVKVNVQKTKDCFEVYALVPGLLREEVRVQSDPAGRLVISGEPEHPNNPWGVTPFKKVVSLPSRIDPHQTSAVVTLHGQLFVRVPFEQSE